MNWKTLLVPHDFSPSADRALTEAAALARHHGARLILLHVAHLPKGGLNADAMITDPQDGLVRVDAYLRKGANERLGTLAAPLIADGVPVETRVEIGGDIAEEILEHATRDGADVIVMGTHGRTGLAHLFLGSMTEKVLRHASVPVLTVRIATD